PIIPSPSRTREAPVRAPTAALALPGWPLARARAAGRRGPASGRAAARGPGDARGDLSAGGDDQDPLAREAAAAVVGVGRRRAVHVDVAAVDRSAGVVRHEPAGRALHVAVVGDV